ncbi:hypothetical protein MHYP_G00025850 [Metynnis hypsauchen]
MGYCNANFLGMREDKSSRLVLPAGLRAGEGGATYQAFAFCLPQTLTPGQVITCLLSQLKTVHRTRVIVEEGGKNV